MIIDNNSLTEILLCLPAKSLVRFKSVCKEWLTLISSDYFSHLHVRHQSHSRLEPSLVICLAEKSDYFYCKCSLYGQKLVRYHLPRNLIQPTICSGSNGLFLLQCPNVGNPLGDWYIYNPTTKQSRMIVLNINEKYCCVMGLNLAFDPSKSPYYKIVCIRATKKRSTGLWRSPFRRCQVEVYESETRTWKLSGELHIDDSLMPVGDGKYLNGGIHWDKIFFDLHDCVVRNHPDIMVPEDFGTHKKYWKYIESNGYLHYVAHLYKLNTMVVFELHRDNSQWSVKYRINLARPSQPLSVVSIIRGESEDALVLHEPGKVIAFKIQENSFKELLDFKEAGFDQEYSEYYDPHASLSNFQFIETLTPV